MATVMKDRRSSAIDQSVAAISASSVPLATRSRREGSDSGNRDQIICLPVQIAEFTGTVIWSPGGPSGSVGALKFT